MGSGHDRVVPNGSHYRDSNKKGYKCPLHNNYTTYNVQTAYSRIHTCTCTMMKPHIKSPQCTYPMNPLRVHSNGTSAGIGDFSYIVVPVAWGTDFQLIVTREMGVKTAPPIRLYHLVQDSYIMGFRDARGLHPRAFLQHVCNS